MLKETRLALGVTTEMYDAEFASLLMAGANDLKIAGVNLGGEVTFTISSGGAVTDNCTVSDYLVIRALITYVRVHFKSPRDYIQLKESYDEQKCQLLHATGYTNYGEDGDET